MLFLLHSLHAYCQGCACTLLCQGGMCGTFLAQFLPQQLLCLKNYCFASYVLASDIMTTAIIVLPEPGELYSKMLLGCFFI